MGCCESALRRPPAGEAVPKVAEDRHGHGPDVVQCVHGNEVKAGEAQEGGEERAGQICKLSMAMQVSSEDDGGDR